VRHHVRASALLAIVATVVCAACSGSSSATGDVAADNAGQRWQVGAPATAQQIAAVDADVGIDGADLPAGRGSAADGKRLYAQRCAACHNDDGSGRAPYPALIGRDPNAEQFQFAKDPKLVHTIGNYWPYAYTVFDYVRKSMPHGASGSLTNDETYAITAYLLAANKVIADSAVLDAASLRAVHMPAEQKFRRDDRTGGPVVR
jgi:cytochrome c